jgi:two-component system phosphate regulon sensor histidine kinase PhoR
MDATPGIRLRVVLRFRGVDMQEMTVEALRQALADKERELAQREQEWAYKQALMLTLANAAYDALLVLDDTRLVIASNNAAEQLFHRPRLVGQKLIDVTQIPELDLMVQDAISNEEETFEEQVVINKRHYRVSTEVIRRDGNLFIGLALQDISELVRLNRARRDMVANISHELRHPIANIRLTIDGLFHEDEKPKRKRSISALQTIARETDALLWIMQEMLDLSMIESGQAIVRMIDVPLAEIVNEAVERMDDQAAEKDIKIIHDVPSKLQVLCDWDQIRRVLLNLIHNAIKWSPKNGTISIHAIADEEEVTVQVIDEGPGVPDDQVERIFERFYQVDSSRSAGEGTGLGLAICKHIVEAHGGRIWAEGNSSASGGRFLFTLAKAENID